MADVHIDSCKQLNGKLQVGLLFHIPVGEPAVEEEHTQTIMLENNDAISGDIEQKIKDMYLAKKTARITEYTQEHKFDGVTIEDATA